MTLSCACCTYGRVSLLEEIIACFLAQTWQDKEMVIFNSFDKQKLVFDHPQVRVINSPARPDSLGSCRNACIQECQSEHVINVDDDDPMLPHYLENYAKHWEGESWLTFDKVFYAENWEIKGITYGASRQFAFTRSAWEQSPYPSMGSGEDQSFNSKIMKRFQGREVALKNDEISLIYSWGQGAYHASGRGNDKPLMPTLQQRTKRNALMQVARNEIPTGKIVLKPGVKFDYTAKVKQFLQETVTV